jgi:hypothetical protein
VANTEKEATASEDEAHVAEERTRTLVFNISKFKITIF